MLYHLSTVLAASSGGGGSIWDAVDSTASDVTSTTHKVVAAAAGVIIVIALIKAKGAVGALVGAGVVGAVAVWLVGGIGGISALIPSTVHLGSGPAAVQIDDGHHPTYTHVITVPRDRHV